MSRRQGRARAREAAAEPARTVDYRHLRIPFPPQPVFSEDEIAAMHDSALRILEDFGLRLLLPESREMFRRAGALVDEDSQMVRIGREIIESVLTTAPRSITLRGGNRGRDVLLEPGRITFQSGASAPHATDLTRGRRPGSLRDFRELMLLTQAYDVLHLTQTPVEPQDIPPHLRHYATTEAQLTLTDKPLCVFARGSGQTADNFAMIRMIRGVDEETFAADPHTFTVINSNSPRQLDVVMSQGIIDFARAGQMVIATPFTLMGAMAPITVAGSITLSHAEALAIIAMNQLARPGAPVMYGTFTSNVFMKSGAPALGTPEQFKATLAAGQLARLIDMPWRCATGSAGNIADAQAAHETQFALWACLLGGATTVLHSTGWLESGLALSYEKFVTDVEVLQMMAELCAPTGAAPADIGLDAVEETAPGGHFFAAGQTLERYKTAFYEPLVADWTNFGTWTEHGARDVNARATDIWQEIVARDHHVPLSSGRVEELHDFIARRTAEGGAPPTG